MYALNIAQIVINIQSRGTKMTPLALGTGMFFYSHHRDTRESKLLNKLGISVSHSTILRLQSKIAGWIIHQSKLNPYELTICPGFEQKRVSFMHAAFDNVDKAERSLFDIVQTHQMGMVIYNEPVEGQDRNFDITRADSIIAYPKGTRQWADYLQSEIDTAAGQGFDVLDKGITLIVKKNGRILRRVTGLPPWGDLVNTMEVIDGSRFGMPGDSEKYGGP